MSGPGAGRRPESASGLVGRIQALGVRHPRGMAISLDGTAGLSYDELAAFVARVSSALAMVPEDGVVELAPERCRWPWTLGAFLGCAVSQRTCTVVSGPGGDAHRAACTHRMVAGPDGVHVEAMLSSEAAAKRARDAGQIVRTSGTTGAPLTILHPYATLLGDSARPLPPISAARRTVVHTFGPESFAGLHGVTLPAVLRGDEVVAMTRVDPERLAATIHATRATVLCTTPSLLRVLQPALTRRRDELASLRLVMVTGEHVEAALAQSVAASLGRRVALTAIYGLSQCPQAQLQCIVPRGGGATPLVYHPSRRTAVRIVADSGGPCAIDEVGELHLATGSSAGWTATGDLARPRPGGGVEIVGRRTGAVLVAGELIGCSIIEEALREHEKVADAVAFGLPHPTLGQRLVALVVPATRVSCSSDELRRFLVDRLKPTWVPSEIRFVADLETAVSGKTVRRGLETRWEAAAGAARGLPSPGTPRPGARSRSSC